MKYEEYNKLRDEFNNLIEKPLTMDSVSRVLEIIYSLRDDDEVAHSMEKDLLFAYIRNNINDPVAIKILEVEKINFSRWFA